MTSQINWRTYDGDGEHVERSICTALHRRFPDGHRRRAASGDGGIDFFFRDPLRGLVVYQIKSFVTTINEPRSRKTQIENSLNRAAQIPPDEWHLVLPLDATEGDLEWFDELTDSQPFTCTWKGRTFCDGLFADFPTVRDYFFADGVERLHAAIRDFKTIQEGILAERPSDVYEPVRAIVNQLGELSPFYKFDIETHPTFPPGEALHYLDSQANSDVVMYQTMALDADQSITIKVRPHYPQAVEDDPLPVTLTLDLDELREAERAAATGEQFRFRATTTTSLPGEAPQTRSSVVAITPIATQIRPEAILDLAVTDADGQVTQTVQLPNCTSYSGITAPEQLWTNENETIQLSLKPIGGEVRTSLKFVGENQTAFTVRREAKLLLAATEPGTSLLLRIHGETLANLTEQAAAQSEEFLATGRDWFEAITLLAQLTPMLDYDYTVPNSRICECDLGDLRNAVSLATGALMPSTEKLTANTCLNPTFWEANQTAGRYGPADFSGHVDQLQFTDMHFIDEPIQFDQLHYHANRYEMVEEPHPECNDPTHQPVRVQSTPDSRFFYHLGSHETCTWTNPTKTHQSGANINEPD